MTDTTIGEPTATGGGSGGRAALAAAAAYGLIVVYAGTGSQLGIHTAQVYPALISTTFISEIIQAPLGEHTPEEPAPAVQSLAERVSAIKAAFGMTISQLAKVLDVKRQTIYDWVDEENPRQIQEQNRERLAAIQRLAVQWNQLCQWPAGKGMTTYAVEGDTLLDLLSADVLDEARLQRVMRGLSEQVKAEWQLREERSWANRLRAQGFQPPPKQDVRSILAGICGTVSLNDDDS